MNRSSSELRSHRSYNWRFHLRMIAYTTGVVLVQPSDGGERPVGSRHLPSARKTWFGYALSPGCAAASRVNGDRGEREVIECYRR